MDKTKMRRARREFSCRRDMTPEEVTEMFNDFAETYDDAAFITYLSMSQYLTKFYKPEVRSKVKVLDVAAGTGALGRELKRSGFLHVDALDPAEKMLEVARSQDIYTQYFVEYMDGHVIKDINTDYYDLLTVSSGFNVGLIPLKGFKEIVRIVKPGGYIVFAGADCSLEDGYDGELSPLLSTLVKWGVLEMSEVISLEDGHVDIAGSGRTGKLYNYKVKGEQLQDGFLETYLK